MKRWLLGLLAMFAVHSLVAERVVGIRADESTEVFAFEDVVSVKASKDGMLIVNGARGAKSAGFVTLKFENDSTNRMQSPAADDGIHIYPNPVSSMLYIVGATAETEITVTDAKGQVVQRCKGASMSVEGLAKGFYILSAQGKKVKFIKE